MKKNFLKALTAIFFLSIFIAPSFAISEMAQKYMREVTQPDAIIPLPNWDKSDLRFAALEVLDAVESGAYEKGALDYVLKTLGILQNEDDLSRILSYDEKMPYLVMSSIGGFSHPDAINCLIRHLGDEKAPRRELAVNGLAKMDFKKLDKPETWKIKVQDEIQKALNKEKVSWLKKTMQEALTTVKTARIK